MAKKLIVQYYPEGDKNGAFKEVRYTESENEAKYSFPELMDMAKKVITESLEDNGGIKT